MLCGEVLTFGFPNSKRVLAFLGLLNLHGSLERQSNFRNFNEFASVLFRHKEIIGFHICMHKSGVTFFWLQRKRPHLMVAHSLTQLIAFGILFGC